MQAFCPNCARRHEWDEPLDFLCPCGRILEPQTPQEAEQHRRLHQEKLKHYENFRLARHSFACQCHSPRPTACTHTTG